MSITPIDIQQHRFKTSVLGYEKSGVDHYLEQVAEELEHYHRQLQELKEELARTRVSLEEMRQREEMLKETLMTAQKMTDDIKANALKEAEILIAEAGLQGEKLIRDAEARKTELLNDLQDLQRQKTSFESSLRGLIEGHLRMLDLDAVSEGPGGSKLFLQGPVDSGVGGSHGSQSDSSEPNGSG